MNKILFIAYKFFDEDPRIVREAAACLRNGYLIDVICVGRPKCTYVEPPKGVTLHTYRIERKRTTRTRYLFEYCFFFLYALFKSTFLHLKNRYRVVQVFVMPELLMFSALFTKMFGAKLLMDWEDPSLEVFHTKYPHKKGTLYDFTIKNIEKLAVRGADRVITPNVGFNKAFESRGIGTTKFNIVMNAPDETLFGEVTACSERINPHHISILYNGTVFERHGLHVAIDAVDIVKDTLPAINLYIVGDGEEDYMSMCKEKVRSKKLDKCVTFIPRLPIEEIPPIINSAKIGIVPNITTPFTEINMPQRILEFGLMKKPMVIPRLSGIADYINEGEATFFTPGDKHDLARAVLQVCSGGEHIQESINRLYQKCRNINWEHDYMNVISTLLKSYDASTA